MEERMTYGSGGGGWQWQGLVSDKGDGQWQRQQRWKMTAAIDYEQRQRWQRWKMQTVFDGGGGKAMAFDGGSQLHFLGHWGQSRVLLNNQIKGRQ
jgi:hypothetical protein